ncbi:hypothetical protein QBC47DRAFT_440723 [Echria macrotheca]|uniref:Uncharacterized protein n=1 Tax=Echria macrotheca TaxID=438768 RepID=A0AAJ0BLR1_9PEZI|nr:hypothetical protein QBC47DRAFT_440723 [Echria macrotheca]
MSSGFNRLPFEIILDIIETLRIRQSHTFLLEDDGRHRENISTPCALCLVNKAIGGAAQRELYRGYWQTRHNLAGFVVSLSRNVRLADALREVQLFERYTSIAETGPRLKTKDAVGNKQYMKELCQVRERILKLRDTVPNPIGPEFAASNEIELEIWALITLCLVAPNPQSVKMVGGSCEWGAGMYDSVVANHARSLGWLSDQGFEVGWKRLDWDVLCPDYPFGVFRLAPSLEHLVLRRICRFSWYAVLFDGHSWHPMAKSAEPFGPFDIFKRNADIEYPYLGHLKSLDLVDCFPTASKLTELLQECSPGKLKSFKYYGFGPYYQHE